MAEWWNGIHRGLKIPRFWHVGSSPTLATKYGRVAQLADAVHSKRIG